ncbi:MAG: methyltransferase domain-containing protein [Candidatus Thorarchaeota archaeon]|jgi:ubiquinone/menaquinone biosynthesis C-methylase UbiE
MEVDSIKPKTWGTYWDHFGQRLVELVQPATGSHVLDVGTGGGASLYPTAKRVGPRGRVTGIETCEGCFNRTSGEIKRCGVSNAEVLFMDARKMTFDDESFDFVTSGFIGWDESFDFDQNRHIAPDKMMSEIFRVLKSGGRAAISGWARADDTAIMRDLLYEYLPLDSPHRMNIAGWSHRETSEGWASILSKAGFVDIKTVVEHYDMVYTSEEEWWEEFVGQDWMEVMEELQQKGIVTIEELKGQAFAVLKNYKKADGIHHARDAVLAMGTKPE